MQPRSRKLLEDVRDAAAFVRQITADRTLRQYSADRMLRQAVERNFEIIGEALKRLAAGDPAMAARIGDYQQVIAFRNILIHGYDLVDHAVVWSVIETQLPALVDDVSSLLRDPA